MPTNLKLVSASAGKRLAAKVIDVLPALAVWAICLLLASAADSVAALLLWLVAGLVLAGAYGIWLWGWEATQGKTPGNLALGLRTTNEAGQVPGWAAVFLRGLILAVAGVVPVAGPAVVLVSNLWDRNGQRQGWHDKVARTLVCDVKAGRDPLTTGGLYGPQSFAPQPEPQDEPLDDSRREPAYAPVQPPSPADWSSAQTAPVPSSPAPHAAAHPDDDLQATRMARPAADTAWLAAFDDGSRVQITGSALLGRNPAAAPGEDVAQLIDYADMGRSVSKTHLHLQADPSGLWVTDRNSTNGSAITTPDGVRTALAADSPALAVNGSTVHFGDRHFLVGRA